MDLLGIDPLDITNCSVKNTHRIVLVATFSIISMRICWYFPCWALDNSHACSNKKPKLAHRKYI